jgi:hypothetical protein
MTGEYLRKQAKTCLVWARECFDLGTATRLRMMADEFLAKADEIDAECETGFEPYDSPPNVAALQTRSDDS